MRAGFLDKTVREALSLKWLHLKRDLKKVSTYRKGYPGRGKRRGRAPEARLYLTCLKNSKMVRLPGVD